MQVIRMPGGISRADAFNQGLDRMQRGFENLGNVISRKEALEYERQRQAEQDALAEQERRARLAMQYDQAAINAGINPMQGASANQRQEFINQGGATGLTGALGDAMLNRVQSERDFQKKQREQSFNQAKRKNDIEQLRLMNEMQKGKGEKFKPIAEIRKEINQNPTARNFNTIDTSYRKIQDIAKNPSAAGDLSLVYNYMKMLDPTSTVMQGEYASAENARGIDSSIIGLYNKVKDGQFLTPSQRQDFLTQAGRLAMAQAKNYKKFLEPYEKQIAAQQLPREQVLPGYDFSMYSQMPETSPTPPSPPRGFSGLAEAQQVQGPSNYVEQSPVGMGLINDAVASPQLDITSPEKTQARQSRIIQLKRKAGLIK